MGILETLTAALTGAVLLFGILMLMLKTGIRRAKVAIIASEIQYIEDDDDILLINGKIVKGLDIHSADKDWSSLIDKNLTRIYRLKQESNSHHE